HPGDDELAQILRSARIRRNEVSGPRYPSKSLSVVADRVSCGSRSERALVVPQVANAQRLLQRRQRLPRDENRIVPFVAFVVVFRQVFPLRPRLEHFEAGITRESAQPVWIHAPTVNRKAMFGSARWNNDTTEAVALQSASYLSHCLPE